MIGVQVRGGKEERLLGGRFYSLNKLRCWRGHRVVRPAVGGLLSNSSRRGGPVRGLGKLAVSSDGLNPSRPVVSGKVEEWGSLSTVTMPPL